MKKLRGTIVGAGYFSQFHGEAWSRINQVEITAICDRNVEKARLYAKKYNIAGVYSELEEMLDVENPDFLDIVTHPVSHKAMILSAASRNVHIICQKPLAETFGEALEIREIIKGSGIRFMVHENWRFQPWYREIKKLIQAGSIGKKIFQYTFRMRQGDGWGENAYMDRQPYFRNMPRLLIHETGVHFVDTFRYLEGEINEVYANLKTLNPVIKGEDAGMVFFRFNSGCTALFDANRYNEPFYNNSRYTFGEMSVEGDHGSLFLHADGHISLKQLGQPILRLPFTPTENGFSGDSVFACQQHFVDRLADSLPFETEIENYLQTLRVVEAIYQSHHEKTNLILDTAKQDYFS
jgi:predicted dehydrogenase